MKIGFDIDGVLADFNTPMLKVLNEVLGTNHQWDPLVGGPQVWDWPQGEFGIPDADVHRVWEQHINKGSFWATCPPLNEEHLIRVSDLQREHELYFITARSGEDAKWQTERWLADRGFIYPTVVMSGQKALIAHGLDLDLYIDDKPENNLKMPHKTSIYLVDAAYNRWATDADDYGIRVKDVADMLDREGL